MGGALKHTFQLARTNVRAWTGISLASRTSICYRDLSREPHPPTPSSAVLRRHRDALPGLPDVEAPHCAFGSFTTSWIYTALFLVVPDGIAEASLPHAALPCVSAPSPPSYTQLAGRCPFELTSVPDPLVRSWKTQSRQQATGKGADRVEGERMPSRMRARES